MKDANLNAKLLDAIMDLKTLLSCLAIWSNTIYPAFFSYQFLRMSEQKMVNNSKLCLHCKCLLKHKGLYLVMGIFFSVLSWMQLNEPSKSCIPCRVGDPVQSKNARIVHIHVHMHIYHIDINSNISVMCSLSLLHIK